MLVSHGSGKREEGMCALEAVLIYTPCKAIRNLVRGRRYLCVNAPAKVRKVGTRKEDWPGKLRLLSPGSLSRLNLEEAKLQLTWPEKRKSQEQCLDYSDRVDGRGAG